MSWFIDALNDLLTPKASLQSRARTMIVELDKLKDQLDKQVSIIVEARGDRDDKKQLAELKTYCAATILNLGQITLLSDEDRDAVGLSEYHGEMAKLVARQIKDLRATIASVGNTGKFSQDD